MKTEYYGAEIQDVQVQVAVAVIDPANPTENLVFYVFNQKVLSDTYIERFTQSASASIKLASTSAVLKYTPIMLQLGRGGPSIGDPVAYVKSFYPRALYNVSAGTYSATTLNTVQSLTSIASSPAADLIEVTATYSLIISASTIYLTATPALT